MIMDHSHTAHVHYASRSPTLHSGLLSVHAPKRRATRTFSASTHNSFQSSRRHSVWRKFSTNTIALSMEDNEGNAFVGVPTGANPKLWFALIYSTFVLAGCHFVCGFISIGVGVITTIAAEQTVYAHTVSPIWSGLSFVVAGFCGISAARKRTVYMIHLFIGVSVCAMILLLISIQLLRLGLVYHTNDGNTFQKDQKDIWIIIALSDAGMEGFICLIAVFTSWKMARLANVPPEPVKDDGPFRIQITKGGSHYMTMSKYTNKRKISSL
ncbi:uncharacterized protein LOC129584615 [Paramacrobiotus metropolitanus]|uniref:uncharacterized protein LOC129584615 n=1 Tax=Paramacrobiotus metropolitanus TaxID=2943436 RepID=UPI002446360D|nr:uncharacterized protein LOC129584615 [Paramacrobiotus metropolitanus]